MENKEDNDIKKHNDFIKPGSKEAIAAGCTCPIIDNHHGHGIVINGQTFFWYDEKCPVHT